MDSGFRSVFVVLVVLATGVFMAPGASAGRTCLGADPTIVGTSKQDFLQGTPGPDVIDAGAGDDFVQGAGGDDLICGRSGDDFLNGDQGNDTLDGASGDDFLDGGDDDTLGQVEVDHAICASGFDQTSRVETNDGRCEEIFP